MRITFRPTAVERAGRKPGLGRGGRFLVRWVVAVVVSMMVAGLVEYTFAVQQLEQRALTDSVNQHLGYARHLEKILASGLPPTARNEALNGELVEIAEAYEIQKGVATGTGVG